MRLTISQCRRLRRVIADAREDAQEVGRKGILLRDRDAAVIAGMLIALETSLLRRSPQGGRKEQEG